MPSAFPGLLIYLVALAQPVMAAPPELEDQFTDDLHGKHRQFQSCRGLDMSMEVTWHVRDGRIEKATFGRMSLDNSAGPCFTAPLRGSTYGDFTGTFVRAYPLDVLFYCVDTPFAPPSDRARNPRPRRAFREGRFPGPLLPLNHARPSLSGWYDSEGRVYGAFDVLALLKFHPATTEAARSLRQASRRQTSSFVVTGLPGEAAITYLDIFHEAMCTYNESSPAER